MQTQSGLNSQFVRLLSDNKTIQVEILRSTFNQPNTTYYVLIDNEFVVDEAFGQRLLGVKKNIWVINTSILYIHYWSFNVSMLSLLYLIPSFLS